MVQVERSVLLFLPHPLASQHRDETHEISSLGSLLVRRIREYRVKGLVTQSILKLICELVPVYT